MSLGLKKNCMLLETVLSRALAFPSIQWDCDGLGVML